MNLAQIIWRETIYFGKGDSAETPRLQYNCKQSPTYDFNYHQTSPLPLPQHKHWEVGVPTYFLPCPQVSQQKMIRNQFSHNSLVRQLRPWARSPLSPTPNQVGEGERGGGGCGLVKGGGVTTLLNTIKGLDLKIIKCTLL